MSKNECRDPDKPKCWECPEQPLCRMLVMDDPQDPKYDTAEYQEKMLAVFNVLRGITLDMAFDACWRD